MSRMKSFYLKPPLPKSPIRLRSRQATLSTSSTALQTPTGIPKYQAGRRLSDTDLEPKLPIDYSSISSEIHALAKMVETEFAEQEARAVASNLEHLAANSVPVFYERGRFYDEYSAKRNERLKRKKGGGEDSVVKGTPYNLGVEPMTAKRRGTAKKKTTVEATPRYSLRSMTKENKKPPLPLNVDVSAMKTVTTRRGRRI